MRTDELDELIAYEVADKAIPSISYALFDAGGIIAKRHVSNGTPLGDDAVFRIGSISKTFAAILAMRLVEQGKLDLDADIAGMLPHFTPRDPTGSGDRITLRKLLSHRSGLTREAPIGHYLDDHAPPLRDIVGGLASSTLKASADDNAYFYSNAGYAVVGAAIEAASRRDYATQLSRQILEPLHLKHTAIQLSPVIAKHLAPARMWTADGDFPAPVFDLGGPAAGNIFSTLDDLAAFGRMLLRGGDAILSSSSLAQMWAPAAPGAPKGYGLGFAIDALDGHRTVGHGGVVYGYASTLSILPDEGIGVILFSTLDFTNELIERLGRHALRLVLTERGKGASPRRPRRLPRVGVETAAALDGIYAAPEGDRIELRSSGTRLDLVADGVPFEIRQIGPGRFLMDGRIAGEGTTRPSPELSVRGDGIVRWGGREWRRAAVLPEPAPPALAAHLGAYGPRVMPAVLGFANGKLTCLMEYFCPHVCEPLADGRYLMHGSLYEREILQLGVVDANGRPAIKVGEMILTRRT